MAVRGEPRPFAVAVAGAAAFAVATVGSAVVLGRVTDRIILPAFAGGRTDAGALWLAAAAILGMAAVKATGAALRRVGASTMQLRLQGSYRRAVSRRYLALPLTWHRQHSTGELLSTVNSDVEATFWPIAPLPFSLGVALLLVVAIAVLAATDLLLALVAALILPGLIALNTVYNRRMGPVAREAQRLRGVVSRVAHESFEGALLVKAMGLESRETARFAEASEQLRAVATRQARIRAVYDPLLDLLAGGGVLVVIAVGAVRVADGILTTGELVQSAYLFTLLGFPVRVLGWLLGDLPRAVAGWERVDAVLRASGDLPVGTLVPHGDGPASVSLDDVTYVHLSEEGAGRGLHGMDLSIPAGRVVAVVGPTGSGKSTAAALLVRLADPDAGAITLDGEDLRTLARGVVPAHVAVVFQSAFLFDDSVRGNVALGGEHDDAAVRAALDLARASDFVDALPDGLDTVVGERGTTLSGGERQRIALARALVRRPGVLVLDDATSSVDPSVEAEILTGLRGAGLPSTVVLIAYRRATVALADEVVLVEHGSVSARGTHADLLATEPAYSRLLTAYERRAAL